MQAALAFACLPAAARADTTPLATAQRQQLVEQLSVHFEELTIRDRKLADDREAQLIAANRARLTALNAQLSSASAQNAALAAQLADARRQYQALLTEITDRNQPGLSAAYTHAASQIVAVATPAQAAEIPGLTDSLYVVYFDFDMTVLDPSGQVVVDEATLALVAAKVPNVKITITGYSDTSVSARYAVALSMRRAEAVADEMVRQGAPRDAILVRGLGKSQLAVQTDDGIREPLNRRVTILVSF